MPWGAVIQPDLILGGSILSLTPEILQQYNLKGLVLDVDDTLVPTSSTEASEALLLWVEQIRQVAALWLVSNNLSRTRIGNIAKALNVPYLIAASKPSRRKLKQAVDAMNLPVEEVAMVGDRLFTDVIAGNRLGMFTILVEPMVHPGEGTPFYPIHNLEVLLSQALGVSIPAKQQKLTNHDKS